MRRFGKEWANLTGMLTSISDGMTTPSANLMKAIAGCSRKSASPTRMAEPWAPAGILLNIASFLARRTSSLLVEYVSSFISTTVSLFFRRLSPASPFFKEPSNGKLTFLFSVSCRFCGNYRVNECVRRLYWRSCKGLIISVPVKKLSSLYNLFK